MTTCWKCKATLRVADAAYCPTCGWAQPKQGGGAPPVIPGATPVPSSQWASRIEQDANRPSWGMAIVWTILFPLAPFVYPVLLLSATRRLRRHVAGMLGSPAMQSQRAMRTPEGQAVRDRLAASSGRVTTAGVLPFLGMMVLLLTCVVCLFIVPAQAPGRIGYERAVESVLEVSPSYGYAYFNSASDYESFWSDYSHYSFDRIRASTTNYRPSRGDAWSGDVSPNDVAKLGLPTYEKSLDDISSYEHPPYEFVSTDYNGRLEYNRVSSLNMYWDGTESAGVMFWFAWVGLYICNLVFGLLFWFRFMRHRQAELLAAAYAVGDPAFHDRLLPLVKQHNMLLTWVVIPLSILNLHMFAFPLLSASVFSRHDDWERRNHIRQAFGVAI